MLCWAVAEATSFPDLVVSSAGLEGATMTDGPGGHDCEMTRPKTGNLANETVCCARLAPASGPPTPLSSQAAVARCDTKSRELGRTTCGSFCLSPILPARPKAAAD